MVINFNKELRLLIVFLFFFLVWKGIRVLDGFFFIL